MKIKIVTTYPPTKCGMADYSKYLSDSLEKVGIKPEIIDIKDQYSSNLFYFLKLAKESSKNMSKEDIVHIEFHLSLFGKFLGLFLGLYIIPFLIWLRLSTSAKIVITMHDSSKKSDAKELGSKAVLFFYYYRIIAVFLKYFSDKMIFHTEYGRKIALKEWKFDKDKIEIIPMGSPMNIKKLDKDSCKKKLGFANKKILLILGYIKEARDYGRVLDSLKKLDKNVILLIAGQVQLKKHKVIYENMLKKIKKLDLGDRVKLLGFVKDEDMPTLLNATDVGIIPYRRTFGDFTSASTAIQLAYNVPILTTNLPPFESFKKDYKCIETYERDSTSDLIKKINSLLKNKSKINSLSKQSKIYWNKNNWDSIGKRTKEFYLSLFR